MKAAFLINSKMRSSYISELKGCLPGSPAVPGLVAMLRRRKLAGFTVVQAVIAMGVIAVAGAAGTMALVQLNNKAAAMRTLNSARAVVQRNIDTALGVAFSATLQPAILAVTSASGSVYDDDGGGDNLVTIVTPQSAAGTTLKGTLTRIVTAQANSDSADIRRVTFRIDYTIRGRAYTYSMTTLRGSD
jgi:type II secretory pathway pseudopilin PulG